MVPTTDFFPEISQNLLERLLFSYVARSIFACFCKTPHLAVFPIRLCVDVQFHCFNFYYPYCQKQTSIASLSLIMEFNSKLPHLFVLYVLHRISANITDGKLKSGAFPTHMNGQILQAEWRVKAIS